MEFIGITRWTKEEKEDYQIRISSSQLSIKMVATYLKPTLLG